MADAIMDRVGGYAELVERARNAGIVTDYDDWQGKRVAVPAEPLTAILEVLERRSLAADSAPGASARESGAAETGTANAAAEAGAAAASGASVTVAHAGAADSAPANSVPGELATEEGGREARPVMPSGR